MESITSVLAAERTGQVHRSAAPIAFLLDHLRGGGAQKIWLTIANALAERGYRTDLVVCQSQGPLLARLSPRLNRVELKPTIHRLAQAYAVRADPGQLGSLLAYFLLSPASPTLPYLPDLVRYLQRERPGALYAVTPDMNIEAALARRRAGVATRLIISERNNIWRGYPLGAAWHTPAVPAATALLFAGRCYCRCFQRGRPRPGIISGCPYNASRPSIIRS